MATLTASVHDYCTLLARSKLLPAEEVDTLARRWTDDVRGGDDQVEGFTRRKRLPVGEAVRLVRQALAGLQHLHERRMVHRDMKPSNMMLVPAADKPDTTWEATVKILDIGLGRELFDEGTPEGGIET